MELLALFVNPSKKRKLKPVCLDIPSPDMQNNYMEGPGTISADHDLIQRSKQRYSNMFAEHVEHNEAQRRYGHPLHPDLTSDVLTCFLALGTVRVII